MMPYFITFILLAFFSLSQFIKEINNIRLLLFIFSTLHLIAFAGFRKAGVGFDDFNYVEVFQNVHQILDPIEGRLYYSLKDLHMEYGYVFLNSLIRYFTDSYTVLFFIVASISVGINSLNYYKLSKYPFLVQLLYFSHYYLLRDMNQIRAGIASAIILFTIYTIYEKKTLKTITLILLASLFHMSAIIAVLPLFVSIFFKKWEMALDRKKIILLLAISVIIGSQGMGHLLTKSLPDLGVLTIKLNPYLEWEEYNYALGLLDITNIKNISILLILLLLWNRLERKVQYFHILILFFVLGVCFRLAFNDFAIIAGRMSSVLTSVEVILIPSLITCFRHKVVITILVILYSFGLLYLNLLSPIGRFSGQNYESVLF